MKQSRKDILTAKEKEKSFGTQKWKDGKEDLVKTFNTYSMVKIDLRLDA